MKTPYAKATMQIIFEIPFCEVPWPDMSDRVEWDFDGSLKRKWGESCITLCLTVNMTKRFNHITPVSWTTNSIRPQCTTRLCVESLVDQFIAVSGNVVEESRPEQYEIYYDHIRYDAFNGKMGSPWHSGNSCGKSNFRGMALAGI